MSAPWLVAAAFAAALALRAVALARASRDRATLAEGALLSRLARLPPPALAWTRAGLLALGAAALAAASLAGRGPPPPPAAGDLETVLVLDASNSMLARDVAPSRLERQRLLARRLAAGLPGRVGIVFFAGRGYVLSPVTGDRDAVLMFVDAVDPSVVGRGGTALAGGLGQALDVLAGGEQGARRAVVLFSDGESTAPDDEPPAMVGRASRAGVPIHSVGVGGATGARIPLDRGGGADTSGAEGSLAPGVGPGGAGFLRDPDGRVAVTRLEEAPLRELSGATGGLYVPGTTAGVDRLLQEMTRRAPAGLPAAARLPVDALLLLAFLFLWVDGFLFRRG